MSTTKRIVRESVLWVAGVLGALCLLSLLAGWLLNVTPLVFASGSMSPTYDAGALGIARHVPADELAVGDVVSVRDAAGNRVTHRVVGIQQAADDDVVLQLRGDANDVTDASGYRVDGAARVLMGVPYAGYALNFAASPAGLAIGALLALGALSLGFSPRRGDDRRATTGRARLVLPLGVGAAVLAGGAVGLSGQAPWAFTSAYWTDTANATVQATTPAPVSHAQPTCTSSESNPKAEAVLSWPALGPAYEYSWQLFRAGTPGAISSGVIPPASPPSTINLTFGIVSGGGQNAAYTAVVQTRLVSNHTNVGSSTTTQLHSGPRPNGPNWWMYCGTG